MEETSFTSSDFLHRASNQPSFLHFNFEELKIYKSIKLLISPPQVNRVFKLMNWSISRLDPDLIELCVCVQVGGGGTVGEVFH